MKRTIAILHKNGKIEKKRIEWDIKKGTLKNLTSTIKEFALGSIVIAVGKLYQFSGNGAYKWSYKADRNSEWNQLRASLNDNVDSDDEEIDNSDDFINSIKVLLINAKTESKKINNKIFNAITRMLKEFKKI